jgi:hypothetical protein
VTLSNNIARMRRDYWELRGVAAITLAHLEKNDGYKEEVLFEGMDGGHWED